MEGNHVAKRPYFLWTRAVGIGLIAMGSLFAVYVTTNWMGIYQLGGKTIEDTLAAGPLPLVIGFAAPWFGIGFLMFVFGTVGNHFYKKWEAKSSSHAPRRGR